MVGVFLGLVCLVYVRVRLRLRALWFYLQWRLCQVFGFLITCEEEVVHGLAQGFN